MQNDKKVITASEINRYIYCHYQWYYERWYGRSKLSELYRERNEKYGYHDNRGGHFDRGRQFHESYLFRDRLRQIGRFLLLAAFALLCLFLFFITKEHF